MDAAIRGRTRNERYTMHTAERSHKTALVRMRARGRTTATA